VLRRESKVDDVAELVFVEGTTPIHSDFEGMRSTIAARCGEIPERDAFILGSLSGGKFHLPVNQDT
jgi:hypothetical protein